MFSHTLCINSLSQRRKKKKEDINAIDYYISSIDGASIDKIGYYHEVYSEKCATGVQRKRRLTPSNEFRRKAKRPENPCK